MIIFLYGTDNYRSGQKLEEIKKKFQAQNDPAGLNIVTFAGEEFNLEKFNNAAAQSGFLVKKRLIITKNLLSQKPAKEKTEALMDLLENFKKSDNVLVFWEATMPDKRSALFKRLSREKLSQEFPRLKSAQLTAWVKKYVADNNGRINNEAVNLLIAFVGDDLWQISNELDKLLAYSPKSIAPEDVRAMVKAKLDENIFGLVDAIGANNKPAALKLLNEQLALGLNEIYILTMIGRQFRILAQLKSLASHNFSQAEIIKRTKLYPFVVKKLLPLSQKFTLAKLQQIYEKMAELDLKLKSTSLSGQTLLDLFILQI